MLTLWRVQNQIAGSVKQKIEQVKEIWLFLRLFSDWKTHHKHAIEKLGTLKRKIEVLRNLEEDIDENVELEEFQTKKKMKREVKIWLNDVEQIKKDVIMLEQMVVKKETYFGMLMEPCIEKYLQKVEELRKQSKFPNGLTLYEEPLVTPDLIGHQRYVETLVEWLNDPSVMKIGVYGVKGVGKTEILKYIRAKFSQSSCTVFDHVYWVSVPTQPSIHKLQDDIAKQVGVDLSGDEDKVIRATKLNRYLSKRGKCVIILDGVTNKPLIEEVGIQRCKLVISTLSLTYCLSMNCHLNLEIKPLSDETSMALFKKILSVESALEPDIEEVSVRIVRECRGLPRCIIDLALTLRGVDDVNEWRDVLKEIEAKEPVD